MANLAAPTSIENNFAQYGIFAMNTVNGGGSYIHLETNLTHPSSNIMFMIEAVGYSYGHVQPIRCAWAGYTYAYNIGTGANSNYTGLNAATGTYYGNSGYLVLLGYLPAQHYACFTLNAYMVAGNGAQQVVSIRRASQNSNSGTYY